MSFPTAEALWGILDVVTKSLVAKGLGVANVISLDEAERISAVRLAEEKSVQLAAVCHEIRNPRAPGGPAHRLRCLRRETR